MLYHYTAASYLPMILRTGALQAATTGVESRERPGVWFSTNPVWEHTATKLWKGPDGVVRQMTLDEMRRRVGLLRIGVDDATAPVSWATFVRVSGIRRAEAKRLERRAVRWGARPSDWFVSFDPVPRAAWLSVEVFENGAWVPLDGW